MKIRHYLDGIEDQKVWDILRVFVDGSPFITGRQMSYLLSMNHKTCTRYLEKLVGTAILERRVVGRAYLYSLRDNYYTRKVIIPLITQEKALYEAIMEDLVSVFSPFCHSIVVYGDYAHGLEKDVSALQVCFIRDSYDKQFNDLVRQLNHQLLSDYELSLQEIVMDFQNLGEPAHLALLQEIKDDGEWVYGDKQEILDVWKNNSFQVRFERSAHTQ
ncbi:hypothetical protein HOH87_04555 [bacterium]|nr:hypothetical protein [bacterium]